MSPDDALRSTFPFADKSTSAGQSTSQAFRSFCLMREMGGGIGRHPFHSRQRDGACGLAVGLHGRQLTELATVLPHQREALDLVSLPVRTTSPVLTLDAEDRQRRFPEVILQVLTRLPPSPLDPPPRQAAFGIPRDRGQKCRPYGAGYSRTCPRSLHRLPYQ